MEKNKSVSHDYHGSVGNTSLNIAAFDNRQATLLEIRAFKCLSLTIAKQTTTQQTTKASTRPTCPEIS
jgi:hypothetical protein